MVSAPAPPPVAATELELNALAAAAKMPVPAPAPAPVPVLTPSFEAFVARAAEPFRHGGGGGSGAARLLAGGTRMLEAVDGGAGDVLVVCSGFTPASDPAELAGATASLKAHGMRLLLVHRLREAADAAVGRFKPRASLRPMPSRGAEIVDVCFILDLTGSMGRWIDQCKTHVSNVIRGLKADLAVGEVRVSFVGYRDWGERNSPHAPRVVVHEFVPLSRVDEVTAAIGREGANGGGDGPEDVIIAIESALRLEWRGDVRVAVFIADAPAHGYSGQGRGGDDFPAGLCPDQRTPLPTLLGRLANEQGVDLLATKLNSYTDIFYNMLAEQYPGGDGFGVLSLTDGAHKFKAAIMGALSEAVLSLIAPSADAAGVQTFDGTTLSSLTATLSASLRESLDAAAAALRGPSAEEAAAAAAEHDEMVGDAASRLAALEVELAAAEAAAADADGGGGGGGDDDDVEMTAPEAVAEIREVEAARETLAAARSRPAAWIHASRLRAALEADELRPVRLALGLSLPTESLAVEAAAALLRAGVCVGDMQAKGYPAVFIDAMSAAGATLMKRI